MEGLHVGGIQVIGSLWSDRIGSLIEPFAAANDAAGDDLAREVVLMALARTDDVEQLRRELARPLVHLVENWSSASTWSCLAEADAVAGDVPLATQLAEHLVPLSGRIALSGISSAMGPVDGYLALALATCGGARKRARRPTAGSIRPLPGVSRSTPRGCAADGSSWGSDG